MQHARTIKLPKQGIPTFRETIGLLMKVRSALNRHLSELTDLWCVLCLLTFSQKTNMSSLTWMSRLRMTRIDCSRLCTTLSSLSRIGNRRLHRVSFWGSGIPGFCRLQNTVYRIVVVHILGTVLRLRESTFGRTVMHFLSRLRRLLLPMVKSTRLLSFPHVSLWVCNAK